MDGQRPARDPHGSEKIMRLGRFIAMLAVTAGVAVALPAAAGAQGSSDVFQSPSGNIRCAYVDQVGVACYTRNNGRMAMLESFGESYVTRTRSGLPGGRVLGYGRTWRRSTFRCYSSTAGMDCWSTYTGNGFFINRSTAYAY
jgi:hypothetical protein